jgi:hypothetical protein
MANETRPGVTITRIARVWLDEDRITHVVFHPLVEVLLDDMKELVAAIQNLNQGKPSLSVTDISHLRFIHREVRKYGASKEFALAVKAAALLSSSLAGKALGNIFLAVNKPPYTARLFASKEDALQWLATFKDMGGSFL